MQNRRLLFTVIIKLLVIVGVCFLVIVFANSLFTGNSVNENKKKASDKEIQTVSIDTQNMFKGQIRKIRWNSKEVGILLRQFPEKLINKVKLPEESLDVSIDQKHRSKKLEYFVYYNLGDSNNCPLFYSAGEFKDVCTGIKFDEAGRMLNGDPSSFKLRIPPHHYNKSSLVIGKWRP